MESKLPLELKRPFRGVEPTLFPKGRKLPLGLEKNTVKSTLLNSQCRPVPITIQYDMNYVYEITLVVICEMYNFIICEIYDLIFIYENSHMKLPKFTYELDFMMKFSFSYGNCITYI